MNKSFYCSITGMDATGKSTLIRRLASQMKNKGYDVVQVREPGGTPTAEAIRETMFSANLTSNADALMMAAARAELIETVVRPALEAGKFVISDRSVACSCAYQGYVFNIGLEKIWQLNKDFAVGDCLPDLELFLDAETEIILQRMGQRKKINRLDELDHDKVREGYLNFYKMENYPFRHIMTNGTQDDTLRSAMNYIEELLK